MLARFSTPSVPRHFPKADAPWAGMRSEAEMIRRIARLNADAAVAPLPAIWTERLERLFRLRGPAPEVLEQLATLAGDMPAIAGAVARIRVQMDAIAAHGIDLDAVIFDASHGRTTLEYYDGFTFSFHLGSFHGAREGWPPIASGGRYDALTRVLGKGREIPAVGGIIRPGLLAELEGAA